MWTADLAGWIVRLIPFAGVAIVPLAFFTGAGGLILMTTRMYKQPANP